jgi:hypothetical protein
MTTKMGSVPSQDSQSTEADRRREQTNLDCRYGKIGIMSVAAAMRYAGAGKNPAYAPTAHRVDHRFTVEFAV